MSPAPPIRPGLLAVLAAGALLAAGCGGSSSSSSKSASTPGTSSSGSPTATVASSTSAGTTSTSTSTQPASSSSSTSSPTTTTHSSSAAGTQSGATHLTVADHRAVFRGVRTFGRDVTTQNAQAAKADAGALARTLTRLAAEYADSPVGDRIQSAARAWARAATALSSGTSTQINAAEVAAIKAVAGL